MVVIKNDYFIKIDGGRRVYIHFDNILSVTLVPSAYQGQTYEEAKEDLVYGHDPESIQEFNADFEKIIKAHAKYWKNKKRSKIK
jgi:hypothetical protein